MFLGFYSVFVNSISLHTIDIDYDIVLFYDIIYIIHIFKLYLSSLATFLIHN